MWEAVEEMNMDPFYITKFIIVSIIFIVVTTVVIRFSIGGAIDCIKLGKKAPFKSWLGMTILLLPLIDVLIWFYKTHH